MWEQQNRVHWRAAVCTCAPYMLWEMTFRPASVLRPSGLPYKPVQMRVASPALALARQLLSSTQARTELCCRARMPLARAANYACAVLDTCRAPHVSCLLPQAAELEALRKGEEARLRAITKEHELLKKEQYKRAQVLFDLRTKERELISEIRWEREWLVCCVVTDFRAAAKP